MPVRARFVPVLLSLLVALVASAVPGATPARAAGEKVAIIVGPVGSLTDNYRNRGDQVAAVASARGATVVKVYSPNATWANVRAAVNGADVIVYFGHGNGYPNPYTTGTEYTDRVNGWGLNRTTANGDGDSWSSTMVYCGEKALLGTLTASDGAAQWSYCGGSTNTDGISPAPGFVMVYGQAHYTSGFGERYVESTPVTTLSEAQLRVRNYSTPVLAKGGTYFATAYGDAHAIVDRVLGQPTATFGQIFAQGTGYSPSTLTTAAHPDFSGMQYSVQRTVISGFHFGDPDYWYAFAGNPNATPGGSTLPPAPRLTRVYPSASSTNAPTDVVVTATFDQAVTGVTSSSFYLRRLSDLSVVPSSLTYNAYWKRAELRAAAPLDPGATYVATVTGGIVSASSGRAITAYSWRFTTAGAAVAPPPGGDQFYSPAARVTVRQGTHTGYRFDAAGRVTAIRTVTLSRESGANASSRVSLANQSGRWFSIVNGAWAGYWLRESPAVELATSVTVTGAGDLTIYDPPRRVRFGQGTHTGYRFDAFGAVIGERTSTLAWDSGADASVRRTLSNQYGTWFAITNGIWAGYWVRESDVIGLP